MTIDFIAYLSEIDQERYRAVILHTPPEMGTAKTEFAKRICLKANGKYLDLLDFFIQNPEMSARIDSFTPEKFRTLLIEHGKGTGLLFIDRLDFILDTYSRRELQDFLHLVRDQWDSFKDGMKTKLILCIQTSQEIEKFYQTSGSNIQKRIVRLSDFNDVL